MRYTRRSVEDRCLESVSTLARFSVRSIESGKGRALFGHALSPARLKLLNINTSSSEPLGRDGDLGVSSFEDYSKALSLCAAASSVSFFLQNANRTCLAPSEGCE